MEIGTTEKQGQMSVPCHVINDMGRSSVLAFNQLAKFSCQMESTWILQTILRMGAGESHIMATLWASLGQQIRN